VRGGEEEGGLNGSSEGLRNGGGRLLGGLLRLRNKGRCKGVEGKKGGIVRHQAVIEKKIKKELTVALRQNAKMAPHKGHRGVAGT